MKKLPILEKRLNASAFAFVIALSATSYSQIAQASGTSTYVGVDAIASSLKFKNDYGNNVFSKKVTPGVNIFVGHMFNDNWGAEIGYETEKKMKRTTTFGPGSTVSGYRLTNADGNESYSSTLKQHHPYLAAIAKTNIFDDNNFASIMLGVSVSHIEAKQNQFYSSTTPGTNITKTFARTKPIAIIKATIEHKFNSHFGLRLLAGWKNTSKIKMRSQENGTSNNSVLQVKPKDTFNLGVGVSYYIL